MRRGETINRLVVEVDDDDEIRIFWYKMKEMMRMSSEVDSVDIVTSSSAGDVSQMK